MAELFDDVLDVFADSATSGSLIVRKPSEPQPRIRDYVVAGHPKVFLSLCGTNAVTFPREKILIAPGEIGIVPKGYPHREQRVLERNRYAHIYVDLAPHVVNYHLYMLTGRGADERLGCSCYERRVSSLAGIALNNLDSLGVIDTEDPADYVVLRKGIILSLLGALKAINADTPGEEARNPLIRRCKRIVSEKLTDPSLSVCSIADSLRIHPDYLSRLFSTEEKIRLNAYINAERIQFAKSLLVKTEQTVTEIGETSGFTDRAYFAKVFHRIAGCSPSSYRRYSPGP